MRLSAETLMFLRPDVAIEDFGSKSLVFLSDSLQVRMINSTAKQLLSLVSENRTIRDIANEFSIDTDISRNEALEIVLKSLFEMEKQSIVQRRIAKSDSSSKVFHETSVLLVNPDVVFWQSRDDEATLYLEDENMLDVINSTAIEVWKTIITPRTLREIHMCMHKIFPEVQSEQLREDIHAFLNHFFKKGFILELEDA